MRSRVMLMVYLLLLGFMPLGLGGGQHDYGKALSKSILYFEAQRSGYLPKDQRITWRANSGLEDGKADGVDLVGGYYDAGDNVKFGLPMAFTITMMSWSIVEYGRQMASSGELGHAMDAVKWGTDYLIKAHPEPYVLYAEVGDGYSDHYCWQRPEDMTTSRKAYRLDVNHPGSDLAGETAAAMAAASLVFRSSDPAYSNKLVTHAKQLFEFADKYRGKYDSSISVTKDFYQSYSGYNDELLWAAAWLYQATDDNHYLDYVGKNGDALGGIYLGMHGFWWDVKFAGVQLLATKFLLQGKAAQHTPVFEKYQQKAEYFACANIGKDKKNVRRTPGGLLYRQSWNNLQFVTGASFLLTLHADYLHSSGRNIHCSSGTATPAELLSFAKSQVDYILGDNPRGTSYMVGYGQTYPQQVHHRSASIPSIKVHPAFVGCRAGYGTWYKKKANNPNVLEGAIVGGPDANDNFIDKRENYEQTEAATYNGAPLLGVLARLNGGKSDHSQLLSGVVPLPTQVPVVSQKPNSPSQPVTTKPSFPPSSSSSVSPQRHLAAPRHAPTPHPVPSPTTPPLRWPSLPHPPSHYV